jgi:replicative DNA helicase
MLSSDASTFSDKLRNDSAEEALIASVIAYPERLQELSPRLVPSDFFLVEHQILWKIILDLDADPLPFDLLLLQDKVERYNLEHNIKTFDRLKLDRMMKDGIVQTATNSYADKVWQVSQRRQFVDTLMTYAMDASQNDKPLPLLREEMLHHVGDLGTLPNQRKVRHIGDAMSDLVSRISYLRANPDERRGVPSGYPMLDELLGGFQKSDLLILAARPGMGKTALMLNIATNAARAKAHVAIFSLEMSNSQLLQRMLATDTGINSTDIRMGNMQGHQWDLFLEAAELMSTENIYLDDTPALKLGDLMQKCRRLQREQGLDLILVDYLQLMNADGRSENRVQEISVLSRGLKELARDLDVPIIAGAQLSRAVEQRADKRPILSDLRESGCLAGDSLLPLADSGARVPLRDLVGQKDFAVWALNPQSLRLERALVSRAFCTGLKPVFSLELASGQTLKATANHRFLSPGGWQRLDELQAGDRLAVPAGPDDPVGGGGNEIHWEPIRHIQPAGQEWVYDLTVPGPANFCINHIIAHNSLEQDADIVIFIYRDVVYNPDTERPFDADLIISKHRNGPTGMVTLLYDAPLTKFEGFKVVDFRADDF